MYKLQTFIIILFVGAIVGCSTVGRIEELVIAPDEIKIINRHDVSVRVEVIGGHMRFVSSKIFKTALLKNLNTAKVFSSAKVEGSAQYELFVIIQKAIHSAFGGDYFISSKWILRSKNGTEIWSEQINGKGSSSDFGGVSRVRSSAERAAKATIANGIEKLSQLRI